jgi:hypothetical protein
MIALIDRSINRTEACAGKVLFSNGDDRSLLEYCTHDVASHKRSDARCAVDAPACSEWFSLILPPSASSFERVPRSSHVEDRSSAAWVLGRAWNAVDLRGMADRDHSPAVASDMNATQVGAHAFK